MPTKVNLGKAINKIHALGNVLHRPLRDVLDSWARVTAISCAKETQPFGTGSEAKNAGEAATARDIKRCYATLSDVYTDLASYDKEWANQFWHLVKNNQFRNAEVVMQTHSPKFYNKEIKPFDGGEAHRAARNKRGRVPPSQSPAFVVRSDGKLGAYIRKEIRAVGFGKGGWADVVRAIGGSNPRGLREDGDITASWITSKAHGYGKAYRGGTDQNPTIRIENSVPYADQILSHGARSDAIRIGRQRMILNLQAAVRAEVKNLQSAA